MALYHDGGHTLMEKKETENPGFVTERLGQLESLITETKDETLIDAFHAFKAEMKGEGPTPYDQPVEDFVRRVKSASTPEAKAALLAGAKIALASI